ncbi:MAG: DUF2812 domain-containing protein [Bacillota bacterium]
MDGVSRSGAFYTFISFEQNNAVYRTDHRALSKPDADEYFGLFQDAGWEHVASYSNTHYFRCLPEACEFPEIHSDRD